jgi:hypothetical protein
MLGLGKFAIITAFTIFTLRHNMMFCRISHHHCNVETTEDFVALCIIILIMAALAALMDFLRKPKKSESADIEISIKIKCDSEKPSSEDRGARVKE